MHPVGQAALVVLQWKLPSTGFEQTLSGHLSLTVDGVRFTLAFLVACGCGLVLRGTPTVFGRQLFALLSGLVLCFYVFGGSILHGAISLAVNWSILHASPKHAGALSWLFNFPHLVVCCAISGDTWKRGHLDFTGALMITVLRAISVCTNRSDAVAVAAADEAPDGGRDGAPRCSEYLRARCLYRSPSMFELASFFFANGSLLGGPFFEFQEWEHFLQRSGDFYEAFHAVDGAAPPSSAGAACKKVAASFVYLAIYASLSSVFPSSELYTPAFAHEPLLQKLAHIWVVGLVARMKFYFVWSLSDANLTLAGFGFNGWLDKSKRIARWDRQTNGWPLQIEMSESTAHLMVVWNCKTGLFLRKYVYEKLTFGKKRPGFRSLMVTNMVSAIWHGLEATYAALFLTGALLTQASRCIHDQEQRLPPAVQQSLAWRGVKIFWTVMSMNYACLAYYVFDIRLTWQAWRDFGFAFHWGAIVLVLLRAALPPPPRGSSKALAEGKGDQRSKVEHSEEAEAEGEGPPLTRAAARRLHTPNKGSAAPPDLAA